MSPKYLPYGIIGSIILLEFLSLTTAGSPLPWAILSHESLGLKIFGWYLVIQFGFTFLALLQMKYLIPDKECPICNKDVKTFIPVYGLPTICHRCRTIFHKNCFISKGKRCPICHPETTEGPEIPFDFTSGFRSNPPMFDE